MWEKIIKNFSSITYIKKETIIYNGKKIDPESETEQRIKRGLQRGFGQMNKAFEQVNKNFANMEKIFTSFDDVN